jgi:cephalosporin-C deacetylase-like acetyl esterase
MKSKHASFRFMSLAICLMAMTVGQAAHAQNNFEMWGDLNRETAIFEPGEEMTFTIKLLKDDQPVEGYTLKWERTGDDGITEKGETTTTQDGATIVASTKQPGFVRLYVTAVDAQGNKVMTQVKGKDKPVFFDGGACVAPQSLKGIDEPADFDAFWAEQKKALAAVPVKVLAMNKVEEDEKTIAYDVKIDCAGGMPVSGYLVMPKDAKEKSLPAEVAYHGYGVRSASYNLRSGANKIYLNINAHGIDNGQPKEYYSELQKTKLKSYAFSTEENADPKTTYFYGMFLRVMRSLQYVKSLPQWNGKDLKASGGSQGGLQSLAAAGLDPDVTECYAWSPWCCDLGRTESNRLVGGWYIKYTPALLYYDPINLVKRANPKCNLFIIANLGDYVCPPSGVWIAYNNFPGIKTIETRQGCEHGYAMKNYTKFIITNKN